MKTTIVLVVVALAAFLYFKPRDTIVEAPQVAERAAPVTPTSIIVAPVTPGRPADQWRTGPNAQTNLTPDPNRWKTSANAQTNATPDPNRWKPTPAPAALSGSSLSDRWKAGPNAQTNLTPDPNRWKK